MKFHIPLMDRFWGKRPLLFISSSQPRCLAVSFSPKKNKKKNDISSQLFVKRVKWRKGKNDWFFFPSWCCTECHMGLHWFMKRKCQVTFGAYYGNLWRSIRAPELAATFQRLITMSWRAQRCAEVPAAVCLDDIVMYRRRISGSFQRNVSETYAL